MEKEKTMKLENNYRQAKHIVLPRKQANQLKGFLWANGIPYEPSEYGDNIYISVSVTERETELVNGFLDEILQRGEKQMRVTMNADWYSIKGKSFTEIIPKRDVEIIYLGRRQRNDD